MNCFFVLAPDRARARHLDGLDALADDLALEVAADGLDLGQLRHRPRPVSRRTRQLLVGDLGRGLLGLLLRPALALAEDDRSPTGHVA